MSLDVTAAPEKSTLPATAQATEQVTEQAFELTAERRFSQSMVVSGVRCMLAYGVFPFLLPLLGLAESVGPAVGIVIGVVAIAFNGFSVRRFWQADHRFKWPVICVNVAVIVLLCYLTVGDVAELA